MYLYLKLIIEILLRHTSVYVHLFDHYFPKMKCVGDNNWKNTLLAGRFIIKLVLDQIIIT